MVGAVKDVVSCDSASRKPSRGGLQGGRAIGGSSAHKLDEHGNQIMAYYYDKNGILLEQTETVYNDKNQKTAIIHRLNNSTYIYKVEFQYNAEGVPVEIKNYNRRDSSVNEVDLRKSFFCYKTIAHFGTGGNLLSTDRYQEDGTLITEYRPQAPEPRDKRYAPRAIYNYNKNGQPGSTTVFNVDSSVKGHMYFRYDDSGRELEVEYIKQGELTGFLTKENLYDPEGHVMQTKSRRIDGSDPQKQVFTYDSNGNKISHERYDLKDSCVLILSEHFDRWGNCTENTSFEKGKFATHTVTEYNEHGDRVRTKTYDKDGTVETEGYCLYTKFDDKGNWTRMVTWDDESYKVEVTDRVFSYYK